MSVFGLFKDGRMTAEAEAALGAKPWTFLGDACETAYGATLVHENPRVASAVESYTQANGITDPLLDLFAPAADGELIMVVTMAGHVVTGGGEGDAGSSVPAPSPAPTPSPRRGGGRGHRGGGGMSSHRASTFDRGELQFSVSFFSVDQHRSVAIADTSYVGPSAETAWRAFSVKLGAAVPQASCRKWNWERGIDASSVERLLAESAGSESSQ